MKWSSWILLAALVSTVGWSSETAYAAPLSAARPEVVAAFAESTASLKSVTVTGSDWVDTKMDVNGGDKLHITATGTVTMGKDTDITAAGKERGWVDTLRAMMVPSAGRGALVGRVGNSAAATPFFVGADGTVVTPIAGRLYLAINQDQMQSPQGKYEATIDRVATAAATASGAAASAGNYDFK